MVETVAFHRYYKSYQRENSRLLDRNGPLGAVSVFIVIANPSYPGRTFHGVVETGMHDVLLGGARDALLEGLGGRHGDAPANATESPFKGLLHGF